MVYLLFVTGFFMVIYGANFLVDGASSIARKFNVSNLVIGLTIVAFGTSAPELIVTGLASLEGRNEIALGNVVGSNILNILLILGVSSIIYPLTVHKNTVWKEIPLVLLSAALIFILGNDSGIDHEHVDMLSQYGTGVEYLGAVSRIDGIVLLCFFLIFLFYAFNSAKNSTGEAALEVENFSNAKAALYLLGGLTGLIVGGMWIVDGAVEIATIMGMSQKFVGLTIVSLGTSLPELVTSIVAARKKQTDIAIGNVVGSNIFNTFFILGTSATINPIPLNVLGHVDTIVNLLVSVMLFVLLFVGKRHTIGRYEGSVFLLSYVAYTAYLIYRD